MPFAAQVDETIENVADKVNAEAAGFVAITGRRRAWCWVGEWIEGTSVITNFDFQVARAEHELDLNLMLEAVAVPVFDRVTHHLLDREVGRKNDFGRGTVALKKFCRRSSNPAQIIEVVAHCEGDGGHGQTGLDAEQGSKLFPKQDTCTDDCRSQEAHGPDSERTGDESSLSEELVKFVDGFGDWIVFLLLGEDE